MLCALPSCTPQQPDTGGAGGSTTRSAVQSSEAQFAMPAEGDLVAVITTTKGVIQVRLFDTYTPQAVENFRLLSEEGYYDNTLFHRVVKDFIIQGGDATGTGRGGQSAWGTPFRTEAYEALRHYAGALCMAPTDEGHQSQFYIVAAPQDSVPEAAQQQLMDAGVRSEVVQAYAQAGGAPYLDGTDTVFGQVYAGMDVVDAICNVRTDENGRPASDVTVLRIEVGSYPLVSSAASVPASSISGE